MLKINNNDLNIEMEFNGIKIFQTDNTTRLLRKFFNENSKIEINGEIIKKDNIILINDLTKFNDLVQLNKNSKIYKLIFDKIDDLPIINKENIEKIASEINNEYYELLEVNDGDLTKIILSFFDILDLNYIDKKKLLFLLENHFIDNKILFIFENIDWIKIKDLEKYINFYNFIFLTNDFRNNILNIKELELIYLNKNLDSSGIEILDFNLLKKYLEKELNIFLDNEYFNNFLKNKDLIEFEKMFFLIKKI